MDVENLAKELILKNMTPEQQMAVLDSIKESVAKAKEVQKRKIGENVDLVVQALKKIEEDIRSRYDDIGNAIEKRVASIKDGRDGIDGRDGKDGKDGKQGKEGRPGRDGKDGKDGLNGVDGQDGVSVVNAHIDFDGSLVIHLSSGKEINVGEVVAQDLAEKIKVITNGGGTSQVVLDTLASLQTQIDDLIPSQSGQSGKFLTTNGTALSWASVPGVLTYKGTWNASTNTPALASGVGFSGDYYVVATAGSTNLDGITDWLIGDWLIFNGATWQKIDQTNTVTSVNGQTGAVSLTTTNINEGTNLYYLDSRARQSLSAGTGISYSTSTGVITNSSPDQTVSLTGAGTTSISGTYPSFTITSNDQYQGTVTSVAQTFTGGLVSVSGSPITSSGTFALTVAGTSGGIPYFSSASTWASSGVLTANGLVIGNGAGAAPSTTTTGTGVLTALGVNTGSAGAFVVNGGALGTPSSGTVTNLTGTASININGTVGATTPNTGAFTTLSATGVATFSAGSAAAPAITTSGDTNTGIFFPAADTIAFTEGGAEAMRIDSSGNVGIGTTSLTGYSLRVGKTVTGAVDSVGVLSNGLVQSDVTSSAAQLQAQIVLAASAFTLSNAFGLYVGQTALSGGAAITSQYGVYVANSLTGATNNYGFYSNIASSANRYNFYAAGTAENYFAGNVGIGAVAGSTTGQLRIAGNGSGATNFNGITLETSIQSGVTSSWRGLLVRPTTQATAFTLSNLYGVYVNPQTFGAGSTVTNQFGFHAENTLTGATNNYGFYSNIASGTGRWNFYANGTADNYFAGNVGIGTSSPSVKLEVNRGSAGSIATFTDGVSTNFNFSTSGTVGTFGTDAGSTSLALKTSGAERMRIDSSGNLGIGTTSPSTYGKFAVQTQTSNAPTVAITGSGLNPQLNHYINDSTAVLRNLNQIQFVTGSSDISNYQGYMTFSTMGSAGGTISERMRINSNGKILFNTTTQNINEQVGMVYSSNAGVGFSIKDSNAQNGNTFIEFRNGTTLAGNITSNGTTTMTYGSASDYRLKENLVPLTGALAKLGSLRPKVGNWKVDGSEFIGFVAHELQEVFPDAVVGEKDRVDADGNPLHQMVDTGSASIIATLTAALQEAHGLIKDLQTRVATLEAK